MNAESFAEYLAQPAKLYQLPYQEIKNLVAEYPFSSNLRYLLLLKAKIEQDPQYERHLHQYAAHSPDRAFLYELLQEKMAELLDLEVAQEERLELLDLGSFQEKEAIRVDVSTVEETPPLQTFQVPPPSSVAEEDKFDELADETEVDEAPQGAEVKAETATAHDSSDTATPTVPPLPQAAFTDSLQHPVRQATHERFARLRRQNLRERTHGSAAQVRKVAKESVAQQADLATETLAILLERQGQYNKAIEMYERLSLLNPEKSRYFAAAIEKLKQKV